jgi:hypothetical protein
MAGTVKAQSVGTLAPEGGSLPRDMGNNSAGETLVIVPDRLIVADAPGGSIGEREGDDNLVVDFVVVVSELPSLTEESSSDLRSDKLDLIGEPIAEVRYTVTLNWVDGEFVSSEVSDVSGWVIDPETGQTREVPVEIR